MAQPQPLSVDDALERLIHQFADPMAFFRELIQNAVDAGSDEIEVRFAWAQGRMVVHVDDWGCGMTREVIESKLTRLFSSSKDGDRTKIGKFGIGFVSVFAIGPEAVCIDTSRDGEHWRVLFDESRTFALIRRDEPIEGTKIQIHKRASKAEFEQFRRRAREVVVHWCKHLQVEVRVEGEAINEPFDLDLTCKVAQAGVQDEHIVVGHTHDGSSFAGFYNRGLTLLELHAERGAGSEDVALLPGLAFKLSSPHIEHTLTRDDVIRDSRFSRALARVRELAADPLAQVVAEQLAAELAALDRPWLGEVEPARLERLERLWAARVAHVAAARSSPLPVVLALDGAPLSAGALARRVVLAERASPTTERLVASGVRVVWMPSASASGPSLVSRLAGEVERIAAFCTATPACDDDERARWQPLARALAGLLPAWGAKLAGVELGHIDASEPEVASRIAITQAEFGEATAVSECGRVGTGLLASRRVLVVSATHPIVRSNLALAQREPELAAYFTIKAFLLGEQVDAKLDEALALAASRLRSERRGLA